METMASFQEPVKQITCFAAAKRGDLIDRLTGVTCPAPEDISCGCACVSETDAHLELLLGSLGLSSGWLGEVVLAVLVGHAAISGPSSLPSSLLLSSLHFRLLLFICLFSR